MDMVSDLKQIRKSMKQLFKLLENRIDRLDAAIQMYDQRKREREPEGGGASDAETVWVSETEQEGPPPLKKRRK